MRYNTGGFNAPSREAIYKRVMELSGGTYSYDEFVEYDVINRVTSTQTYSSTPVDRSNFVPFAPPVFVSGSPNVSKK